MQHSTDSIQFIAFNKPHADNAQSSLQEIPRIEPNKINMENQKKSLVFDTNQQSKENQIEEGRHATRQEIDTFSAYYSYSEQCRDSARYNLRHDEQIRC